MAIFGFRETAEGARTRAGADWQTLLSVGAGQCPRTFFDRGITGGDPSVRQSRLLSPSRRSDDQRGRGHRAVRSTVSRGRFSTVITSCHRRQTGNRQSARKRTISSALRMTGSLRSCRAYGLRSGISASPSVTPFKKRRAQTIWFSAAQKIPVETRWNWKARMSPMADGRLRKITAELGDSADLDSLRRRRHVADAHVLECSWAQISNPGFPRA